MEDDKHRSVKEELYKQIMTGDQWDEVVRTYHDNFDFVYKAVLNMLGETVLHLAVSHGPENSVEQLVAIISKKQEFKGALAIKNTEGNTPLHLAATTGSLRKCICIAEAIPSLGNARNNTGESPLFLAALHGKTDIFVCLRFICQRYLDNSYYRKVGGETILHCAIKRECWDLAYQILLLHKELATLVDEHGSPPLYLLANKPAAFRSGCHLGSWNRIIYHCMHVDVLRIDPKQLIERSKSQVNHIFPENYETCINFYQCLQTMAQAVITKGKAFNKGRNEDEENPGGSNVTLEPKHEGLEASNEAQMKNLLWRYSRACFHIVIFVCTAMMVIVGFGSAEVKKIKERHLYSLKVLKVIINSIGTRQYLESGKNPELTPVDNDPTSIKNVIDTENSSSSPVDFVKHDPNNQEKREASILVAAGNGITEMVEEILKKFPMAIHDVTSEGKNIVLLAAESRQPQVYQLLLESRLLKETMLQKLDNKGNSALHLATKLGKNKPWLIPGAALQMQWELKWYEFVKFSVPQYLLYHPNGNNKTPAQVFTEDHEELVNKGGEWLNKTSESCSVVAALIATVAFATSTAVPGGIKESSGTPTLETHPAFDVFAVISLVALCVSVTALFLFLAILTSRYQEKDFRSDLPRKLLLGLTSLFVSIASILISFCAGHFFVLKDKLKNKALPVYAVTCLPITLYAISQFPLYFDLVKTYYRKVPRSSYKVVSL